MRYVFFTPNPDLSTSEIAAEVANVVGRTGTFLKKDSGSNEHCYLGPPVTVSGFWEVSLVTDVEGAKSRISANWS